MEIQGKHGFKTVLKGNCKTDFGRGLGSDSSDRTVSRRHVAFELHTSEDKDENQTGSNSKTRVCFEVIGKNPIWVFNSRSGEIRVFRRFERGEMEAGDKFCVSAKKPVWSTLKTIENEGEAKSGMKRELGFENQLAESLESSCGLRGIEELELQSMDVPDIDPVEEFGFVVMGHEFDCYPKQRIRDIKNWDWFLEERREDSEDDEVLEKKEKRRKRKKVEGDDDDWTGEREDDKELITKLRKVRRPKYSTRSKDCDKPIKDTRIGENSRQNKTPCGNEEYIEDEDEDDDTLGGFIVNDDDVEQEEESDEDEDEEDYNEEELVDD